MFAVTAASNATILKSALTGLNVRIGASYTDFHPQGVELLAYGTSAVAWNAQVDVPWITLSPASGTVQPGRVDPGPQAAFDLTQLVTGSNRGTITIHSGAVGSDLTIPVEIIKQPPGNLYNRLIPLGLIFVPPFPPATVTYVPSSPTRSLRITPTVPEWLNVSDTTQGGSGAIHTLRVLVDSSKIQAGIPQVGRVTIEELNNGNAPYAVLEVLAYLPAPASSASNHARRGASKSTSAAAPCIPSYYTPLSTSFFQNFDQNGGAATSTEIAMIDDCGNPVTTGVTGGVLDNGDPQLNLRSLGDGRWKTTWNPATPNSYVTLRIIGTDPGNNINPTAPV